MYITKIKIQNFRLLKETTLELGEKEKKDLTLLIGRNNSGKTSFIMAFDKFFKNKNIDFNDFSMDLRSKLLNIDDETNVNDFAIRLILEIKYTKEDNLENLSNFMLDLDTDNNFVKILFECTVDKRKLLDELSTISENKERFIEKYLQNYLNYDVYAFENYDNIVNERNLLVNKEYNIAKSIINYEVIHAKREVASSEDSSQGKKVLSYLSAKYFDQDNKISFDELNKINSSILEMDKTLNDQYENYFSSFLNNSKNFLGLKNLKVVSDLQSQEILKNHSKIVYGENDNYLPEHLNGLGYMNILYLLLNIEIKKDHFINNKKDINLLFIEEPEAHTHPQMQYVFIEKIKQTLKDINKGFVKENDFDTKKIFETLISEQVINDDGLILDVSKLKSNFLSLEKSEIDNIREILKSPENLQMFLSSHSSHIVKRCDFKDIHYFKQIVNEKNIEIKNFYTTLESRYGDEKDNFNFLKQYLTISSSELFFAEKIIFIEGISESLLLPYFIDKFDKESELNLSSQNISILEVGANSRVFKYFLEFLGIKTLIITDIDTTKKTIIPQKKDSTKTRTTYPAHCVESATHTSNYSLKYYLDAPEIKNEVEFNEWFTKLKADKLHDDTSFIKLSYQIEENSYHARSLEDAFIKANINNLEKHKVKLQDFDFKSDADIYELTKKVLKEFDKSNFASSILYLALTEDTEWNIPLYIKKGLEWIAKN
ncbi:MAG: ATP-dependent endonuclease [Flavobacteriaceae bacterium]|nr:ATP-dependent endonuclease [Flavobacteriaceae bacterium]